MKFKKVTYLSDKIHSGKKAITVEEDPYQSIRDLAKTHHV